MSGRKIANNLIVFSSMIITYLGYFVEVSPYIGERFGEYTRGMLDGGVATVIVLAIIFYGSSLVTKEKAYTQHPSPNNHLPPKPNSITSKSKIEEIEEMITYLDELEEILNQVVNRAGGYDSYYLFKTEITETERKSFKNKINWMAKNYPAIAKETKKGMTQTYIDPLRGIKVDNYDPLLQIISLDSLSILLEKGRSSTKEFRDNLVNGRARLLAYIGYLNQ